jgi:hypothetical protein
MNERIRRIEEIGIYELGWDKNLTDHFIKTLKRTIDESFATDTAREAGKERSVQEGIPGQRQGDVEGATDENRRPIETIARYKLGLDSQQITDLVSEA